MNDPNAYNNVPKSNIGRKKVVWKDISVGDIIFIIIAAVCAFAIPFPIPNIPILVKIGICIGICVLCFLLLLKNKTTGLRYYKYFWMILKFLVTKKKYSKQEIDKTISKVKIENNCIKQVFNNQSMFLKAFKIHGFDLLNTDTDEQIYHVDTFHSILSNMTKFCTLVKIKETHDWDANIKMIYEKIDELKLEKHNFKTQQQYKSKLNQLHALLDWYMSEKEQQNYCSDSWYLFCFGNTTAELEKICEETYFNWSKLFFVEEMSLEQNTLILKNIWEPLKHSIIDLKDSENFDQLPDEEIHFYSDQIKIGKDKFYSIGTLSVDKFPLSPDLFWLNRLSKVESTSLIINLNPIQHEQAKKIIQKTINNSAYMENQFNRYKQAVQKAEYQQQMEAIESVKENVASGREMLINTNIYFLTYGNSSANCKLNVSKLKTFIKNENMVYNPLSFRQKDFFGTIIPNGLDNKIATESIVYPALPLAASFPIMNSSQIDTTGCLLGINQNNNPVVLDVNLRNSKRINSNGLVLGNTGSGKTTTVKKILNNHLANDGIAFVLDPEQDYVHLTNYYDGKVIDASNGNKVRINPLQILLNESDEENANSNLISNHISLIMQWFKILDINLSQSKIERLKNSIIGLYKKFGLYITNLYETKPEDFPTFTDLVNHMYDEIEELKNRKISNEKARSVYKKSQDIVNIKIGQELMEIIEVISQNFLDGGVYDDLYNGHSTLKIGEEPIVDFDVKNLLANTSPNRKVAQMLLIIAYIQNAINLNGYSSSPKKAALLIVDEAHLFIDAKYPDVLIFLSQMSKRIRKRSGGVWITTQNPSDFIATEEIVRYTRSLMENTQYSIIQTLKPNDANAIVEMYKHTPNPITEYEKKFIQEDKKGQALVIVSNKQRQCVQIMVLEEEFKAIGETPLDKFNINKIDMDLDFDDFELLTESEVDDLIEEQIQDLEKQLDQEKNDKVSYE